MKADDLRDLMRTEGRAVAGNTQGFNRGRYESVARLENYEELKEEARATKEDAIERLPELIDRVTEAVEASGGTVYLADDAADASEYVRSVAADRDADRVVKSKSMTSEEIEVNETLERDGVDVVETDLAEWVLQVAGETPSHIVVPAAHKTRDEIADLLNERFDPADPLETPTEMTRFAREHLGERIEAADLALTGANFVAAETGTMALVTSEGNARKCIAATDTHVAVSGIEKLVPTVEDFAPFVELIGRSGTGQDITSYVTLLTPPVATPTVDFDDDETPLSELDADRDFHLVLLDNGRRAMREDDDLRETLYCIRCGACSNACANFQQVGGHAFGGETYSGGIATGWEAGIEGLDVAAGFNDLCTGCSRCVEACPVGIDVPWINTVVRDRVNRQGDGQFDFLVDGLIPDEEDGGAPLGKRFFGNFETVARAGSAAAPLSNWLADTGLARLAMQRLLGVDARRDLPTFERETLVEWAAGRDAVADPERRAVLYPDLYTNYLAVDRGRAAVRVLEDLGVDVTVPPVASSGRAPLSQGMIATARDHAERVADGLATHLDEGRDVVVVEPSALAMFHNEYGRLLDAGTADRLAAASYEILEYVYGLVENGAPADALRDGAGERVAYHSHCQGRTLELDAHTVAVLEDRGFDVVTSDAECCGMAGSFGYKSDYYEVSVAVGEELADQFTGGDAGDRTVVASGTSCLEQLDHLLDRPPVHPVELLDRRRDTAR